MTEDRVPGIVTRYPVPAHWSLNFKTFIKPLDLLIYCTITLHYITLHYITLHYITLHYITLHYKTFIIGWVYIEGSFNPDHVEL